MRWLLVLWLFQLIYTLSPVDVIPDIVPVVGWLDDLTGWGIVLALTAWTVTKVVEVGPVLVVRGREVAENLEARGARLAPTREPEVYEPLTPEEIVGL